MIQNTSIKLDIRPDGKVRYSGITISCIFQMTFPKIIKMHSALEPIQVSSTRKHDCCTRPSDDRPTSVIHLCHLHLVLGISDAEYLTSCSEHYTTHHAPLLRRDTHDAVLSINHRSRANTGIPGPRKRMANPRQIR